MPKYTTRVELQSAAAADYNKLHAAMEGEGFSRTIKSDDGRVYQLPTAEYDRVGDLTRSQVLESAKRAATKVGKTYQILVTESSGRTWHGLKKSSK
jgi:hypothetical protein